MKLQVPLCGYGGGHQIASALLPKSARGIPCRKLPQSSSNGYALADTGIFKFIRPFRLISDTHSATVLVKHPN